MTQSARHLHLPPFTDAIPAPIYFRSAWVPASSTYPVHSHPWGEFVYSYSGVMDIKMRDQHFLAPPHYGVWLPPEAEHVGRNRYEACHCSLYIARSLCIDLPQQACALTITPLIRALLDDLHAAPPGLPQNPEEQRLLQVLLDKLRQTSRAGSYLPGSDDPILAPVLQWLERNPGETPSLQALATMANTTERTLLRRCQRDLGMPLAQWKQRLTVVRALERLETPMTVEAIALDLGYSSSSAFIGMFRKLMGVTPDEFRKARPHAGAQDGQA